MNYFVIFLTGLTVGGFSCLAVQSGLLASLIAASAREKSGSGQVIKMTGLFLFAKLIAHMLLGGLLGLFGSAISINEHVQLYLQIMAGMYMILVAGHLFDIHPLFRYIIISPPRIFGRLIRNKSKSSGLFAPVVLGVLTILIPCGTTIAMEVLAISSAHVVSGALILGIFVLGTSPLFFGVGVVTSLMGAVFQARFMKIAGLALLFLGIYTIYGSLIGFGLPLKLTSLTASQSTSIATAQLYDSERVQSVTIVVSGRGYNPEYIRVKAGIPVRLTLQGRGAFNCASAFRIPAYRIALNIQPNDSQSITFTPEEKGKIVFTCSMGMFSGIIEAI